jgi:hypothetical protein
LRHYVTLRDMSFPKPESGYIEDGRFYEVQTIADPIAVKGPPIVAIPVGPPLAQQPQADVPARPSVWPKLIVATLAVLVVVAIAGLVFVLLRPGPAEATSRQITACREKVKTQLKAPATAQFSGESVTKQPTGGLYEVRGVVDAENGFGALLRQRYTCTATADGQALAVTVTAWT